MQCIGNILLIEVSFSFSFSAALGINMHKHTCQKVLQKCTFFSSPGLFQLGVDYGGGLVLLV